MRALILGSFVVFASAAFAEGEIYRWVDPGGQVHYGQTPPREANYERIPPRQFGVRQDRAPTDSPLAEYARSLDQARAERSKRSLEDAQAQRTRQQQCEQVRAALAKLESRPPNRIGSRTSTGEYERWTPERHEAERGRLQQLVQTRCSD